MLIAFNIDVTEVVGRARREEKKKERKLGVEDASLKVLRTALLFVSFATQVSLSVLSVTSTLYAFTSGATTGQASERACSKGSETWFKANVYLPIE